MGSGGGGLGSTSGGDWGVGVGGGGGGLGPCEAIYASFCPISRAAEMSRFGHLEEYLEERNLYMTILWSC